MKMRQIYNKAFEKVKFNAARKNHKITRFKQTNDYVLSVYRIAPQKKKTIIANSKVTTVKIIFQSCVYSVLAPPPLKDMKVPNFENKVTF